MHAGNLPLATTSFVGRSAELETIAQLLDGVGVVTLTGAGGGGKTRLAIEAASSVAHRYEGGAWLVELASVDDPSLVVERVAEVLGVRETDVPLTGSVVARLRRASTLIILDNCEHLLDGCADLASRLTSRCPELRVLATSREPLDVRAETVVGVPPLDRPDAAELFRERALRARADVRLDDATVAAICDRLDGIPLAIELAAARVKVMSPAEIGSRLSDRFRLLAEEGRPDRHRTLRACIGWSYDLLTAGQQRLLRALSMFPAGATLDAAVSATGTDELDLLDDLTALTDRSLVVVSGEPARYSMLETVRAYASEHAEPELRDGQAGWCLALAHDAERHLSGPDQTAWLHRLEQEHDNLRLAFDREPVRLAAALGPFWHIRGHWREGRARLERALAAHPNRATTIRLLSALGDIALALGDHDVARRHCEARLDLARESDDRPGVADALNDLGTLSYTTGDRTQARMFLEGSLEIYRDLAIHRGVGMCLQSLGAVAVSDGDLASARRLFEDGLEAMRAGGDGRMIASAHINVGVVAMRQGDLDGARTNLESSIGTLRETGDATHLCTALHNLGTLELRACDPDAARARFEEALALAREHGARLAEADALNGLGIVAYTLGDLASAAELYGRAVAASWDGGRTYTNALEGSAAVSASLGDADGARRSFEDLAAAAEAMDEPIRLANALMGLARLEHDRGDPDGARALLERAASLAADRTHVLVELARIDLAAGDASSAMERCRRALADAERSGSPSKVAGVLVASAEAQPSDAPGLVRRALDLYRQARFELGYPDALEVLAGHADAVSAARMLGAAAAMRERSGARRRPGAHAAFEAVVARAEDGLGPARYAAEHAAGRAMSIDDLLRSPPSAMFRRDGDFWTVSYAGADVRLKDARGMGYIARLLAEPGRELHVLDLAGRLVPAGAPSLDRIDEMRSDLEDAETSGDAVRAERLQHRLDAALYQLAGGARTRETDRARWAVEKAVRRCVQRVRDVHPELASHLSAAIRTGTYCSYAPDRPIDWTV